jgi:DNA gyrase subunit B
MPRKKQNKTQKTEYTAKDIFVLKGLEPVRKRPAMYIGSTGPEGLHHLVWECLDNSVTYSTPVFIREDKKIRIVKIGELVDKYFKKNSGSVRKTKKGEAEILREELDIEVLSFDPSDLKLKFRPVFSLIRHQVNSEIFRITLQNNREIEITPYHSLFTLKDGQVLPIKGSDLKIGDPVVVPKAWPEPETNIKEIDLIDEFLKISPKKTEGLHLYNVKNLLTKEIFLKLKPILEKKATQNYLPANIFYDYKRWDYLPFNLLRALPEKEVQKFKKQALIGTRYFPERTLKPKLKINRYLVELLGLFSAEGTIIKNNNLANRIVFSLGAHEKDLINYTCQLIQEVFGLKVKARYAHDTARTVAIDSYLVTLIFKEILRTGENSLNKRVPDLIFNLDKGLRERYLIAYLSGDGYPTKIWIKHLIQNTTPSKEERRKFSAVGVHKEMNVSLAYLLSSLNKTYSYGERKGLREGSISVIYKGVKKRRKFRRQGRTFVLDFYWNTNSSYFSYLPFNEIVEKCLDGTTLNHIHNHQRGISKNKVLSLLEREKLILKTGALRFINSDLGILRVKKIERIKYKRPWVYDISVPNGENFVAGFAPICAHNSIDEAMAGYATEIEITLLPNNRVRVSDNGRGIPVDIHPQTKKSALETVMTTLHAGAKFGSKVYQVSGGLHGVGVSVVCALSSWMKVEVCRGGNKYSQEYSKGKPKTKLKKGGKCKKTGTTVMFEPDSEIFNQIKFGRKKILNHLRRQAYLTKGVKIKFEDLREKNKFSYTFYFDGGLKSYIKYLIGDNTPIHKNIFYVLKEKDEILVEAAFQYTQERESWEESFANNIYTEEGGSHLTGFRSALTRTLNDYAKKNGFIKPDEEGFSGQDVREGLNAAISVKIKEPQFEGQTKTKLGNPEAKAAVESVVGEAITDFLERNPQDARVIIENCLLAAKARKAAKAARQTVLRKGILDGLSLPGKLADCSSRNPEEAELFIVEGESAGGSGKQARDRRFQAILPLRGKILNVERARLDKILTSEEIKALIIALGTAIGQDFDINKIRYHRIIIMCDADSDGNHIRTLLLTLFYRYFRPVIEKGYLYIAQPPLYKIQYGKKIKYAYSEEEKERILKELKKENVATVNIQRYKGLGEMNPEQLWETTMNPERRVLLQVTIEDAKVADRIFDVLMGKEVLPRKRFIQAYARSAKNLDI